MIKKFVYIMVYLLTLTACGEQAVDLFDSEISNRIPIISIVAPNKTLIAVDESYKIDIAFKNIQLFDTWNLYYISDVTPNKSASIATALPVTSSTLAWNTTEMPAGEYYFYAELVANNSIVNTTSLGSIFITHKNEVNNAIPRVTLTSPNGGENFVRNSEIAIQWQASDSNDATLSAKLEYSINGGNSWTLIEDDIAESSYAWQTDATTGAGISYKVRVTVEDSAGSTATDVSNQIFSIY